MLVYDRPRYIGEYLSIMLHKFETCKELSDYLNEEFPDSQVEQFKLIAKADPENPLREYFKMTCQDEVEAWDGTVTKKAKKEETGEDY